MRVADGTLQVSVRHDGGADLGRGSGPIGLDERVEARQRNDLGHQPVGAGTALSAESPVAAAAA